jgi:translation initiation factor 2-alpha kinase 4
MALTIVCSVSRQELVSWLQHQIAEQKRIDATTSGAPALNEPSLHVPVIKDTATNPLVQVILTDPKKQRKSNTKSLFENKGPFPSPHPLSRRDR